MIQETQNQQMATSYNVYAISHCHETDHVVGRTAIEALLTYCREMGITLEDLDAADEITIIPDADLDILQTRGMFYSEFLARNKNKSFII
jgi:hypothetical protein